ncbi:MAG: MBL fold metallo-hydrolase [Syntrophales bacterium]|nr:MBL fold metallo-hydrolase [Syntrophales bacterium]
MTQVPINEVDKVEILTLQDNYIDLSAMDNSAVIFRALPLKAGELKVSILAEHGFSALVKTTTAGRTRTLLFDFGFSGGGAAENAATLGVDMKQVEAIALSHGHIDHTGGMERLAAMIGRKEIPLIVHPAAFKYPRYLKYGKELKIHFPRFMREMAEQAGLKVIEVSEPRPILNGDVLFLGEIPHQTDFEKGFPVAHFMENGVELRDPIEDDTSVVINLRDKGLVIISGCAHAGIINTIRYAMSVTGITKVHVVMGGFHLSGSLFEPIIDRTTEELKKIQPDFVVPTHCTGRKAIMNIEREMPGQFILNMSGTKLTFAA